MNAWTGQTKNTDGSYSERTIIVDALRKMIARRLGEQADDIWTDVDHCMAIAYCLWVESDCRYGTERLATMAVGRYWRERSTVPKIKRREKRPEVYTRKVGDGPTRAYVTTVRPYTTVDVVARKRRRQRTGPKFRLYKPDVMALSSVQKATLDIVASSPDATCTEWATQARVSRQAFTKRLATLAKLLSVQTVPLSRTERTLLEASRTSTLADVLTSIRKDATIRKVRSAVQTDRMRRFKGKLDTLRTTWAKCEGSSADPIRPDRIVRSPMTDDEAGVRFGGLSLIGWPN